MLIPKGSHLVERAAARLLKTGALDESAAQLLHPGVTPPDSTASAQGTTSGAASSAEPTGRRSSLFAPPPPAAAPAAATPSAADVPVPPLANGQAAPLALEFPPSGAPLGAIGADSVQPGTIGLPGAANLGQPTIPGHAGVQAAVLERPPGQAGSAGPALPNTASPTAFAGPSLASRTADPAAGALQGPVSIDAVSLERAGMVDWSRTRTRISEEFRLVQRQILRSAFGPGAEPGFSNLLLVTSARPGEGKSFMSTNLAGSIARQGDHHVLLIDSDSKRDSICYSFGLAQARGLLDLAANPKLDPAPLIVKTPIERLSILPVGRERERSAELFSTKEMTRLIQSLGRRYADRLLILDAPPCLSTSDPAVLSQVVGQILFVVEADRTQRDEIEASLDLIQACPSITLVLNKQQISSRYTFGAYSSYYSS
jgi:protein-tyrosine kinase